LVGKRETWSGPARRSLVFALAMLAALEATSCRTIRADEPVASTGTHLEGVTADIVQCRRRQGSLTVVMQLHTAGPSVVANLTDSSSFYIISGNKKYFLLRDAENTPIARNEVATLQAGHVWTWWGRFAAPPTDISSVDLFTPVTIPFEDIPVSD
jgi:hypothetical protein